MNTQSPLQAGVCERVTQVLDRLQQHYGCPTLVPNGEPVAELVGTVLSQHTTDASSARAFAALQACYTNWQSVANAPVDEVADVVRPAGLHMQKARTIKTALNDIGEDDLNSLAGLPVPEARARLTAICGVGDKTASCVLLFALGMAAQPVDTHIERVSKRIGIAGEASSATRIRNTLERCLPADGETMYAFHVNMVRLGREICRARVPQCRMCMLTDLCDFYARTTGASLSLSVPPFEDSVTR
jgi:endonuclease-3